MNFFGLFNLSKISTIAFSVVSAVIHPPRHGFVSNRIKSELSIFQVSSTEEAGRGEEDKI